MVDMEAVAGRLASASCPSLAREPNAFLSSEIKRASSAPLRIRSRTLNTPLSYRQVFSKPWDVTRMRLQVPQKVLEYAAIIPSSPFAPGIL